MSSLFFKKRVSHLNLLILKDIINLFLMAEFQIISQEPLSYGHKRPVWSRGRAIHPEQFRGASLIYAELLRATSDRY